MSKLEMLTPQNSAIALIDYQPAMYQGVQSHDRIVVFNNIQILAKAAKLCLRPGETFSYSEAGPQGLLTGKRIIVIESRGGLYSEGPTQALDFQEPYLRTLLRFIGLTDVSFIHAEKLGLGPQAREAAVATARTKIAAAAR